MKAPSDKHFIHGGMYLLCNKMRLVGDMFIRGITSKQWLLLRVILDLPEGEPSSFTRIAQEMHSTRQNVTKMLQPLEKQGYVLLRPSTRDGRTQEVTLTDKAKAKLRDTTRRGTEFVETLLEGVPPEDIAATRRTMQAMMDNLHHMQKEYEK